MNDLLRTSLFSSLEVLLSEVSQTIVAAETIQLMAPADIEGMLALSQLEASFLDNGISYRRRVLAPRKHVPRDEISVKSEGEGLTIHIDPFHESVKSFIVSKELIHICPSLVEVSFGTSSKIHHGAIDCVAICGALASMIAPDGARVRRQRSMVLAGTWLRQSIEANYDPIMSMLRDHLDEEGSIDIRTIVEVKSPAKGMIPGLSERMLKRLQKGWATLDVDERSSAISELVLPSLRIEGLSTMRLEELIWHRALVPGHDIDIASQLHLQNEAWPIDADSARVHASTIADNLIVNGHL